MVESEEGLGHEEKKGRVWQKCSRTPAHFFCAAACPLLVHRMLAKPSEDCYGRQWPQKEAMVEAGTPLCHKRRGTEQLGALGKLACVQGWLQAPLKPKGYDLVCHRG